MKRLAVVIAAALILLSASSVPVFAEDYDNYDNYDNYDESSTTEDEVSFDNEDTSYSDYDTSEESGGYDGNNYYTEEESSSPEVSEEVTAESSSEVSQESNAQQESSESESSAKEESSKASVTDSTAPKGSLASRKIDIDKLEMATYNLTNADMFIDIPKNMNILKRGMSADDPALLKLGIKKEQAEEMLIKSDSVIKAFADDYSYDITVTYVKNKNTQRIGNISSLDDKQIQKIIDNLLSNKYAKGCAQNRFNDVLFLTVNMEYQDDDGSMINGIQQYTVINDVNIMITLQVKDTPITNDMKAMFNKVMSSVFFENIKDVSVEESKSDIGNMSIQDIDRRYFLIIAASIIAAAALAGIIVVAIKRRETVALERGISYERLTRRKDEYYDDDDYEDEKEETKKPEPKKSPKPVKKDSSVSDNSLYSNSKKASVSKEQNNSAAEKTATSEIAIPGNPYTPVGKAEAVAQPALSVTSEIAKFSIINEQAKKAAEENKKKPDTKDGAVVFAENVPKSKTTITQVGKSVLDEQESDKKETEAAKADVTESSEPVSEYERRFGKNRGQASPADITIKKDETDEVFEEKKDVSNFEKRFGRVRPAEADATASTAALAEVKPVGELNIAPMITAETLRPENDPSNMTGPSAEEYDDKNLAYLDDGVPQTEVQLKIEEPSPHVIPKLDENEKENLSAPGFDLYSFSSDYDEDYVEDTGPVDIYSGRTDIPSVPEETETEEQPDIGLEGFVFPIVEGMEEKNTVEVEPVDENKSIDDYLDIDSNDSEFTDVSESDENETAEEQPVEEETVEAETETAEEETVEAEPEKTVEEEVEAEPEKTVEEETVEAEPEKTVEEEEVEAEPEKTVEEETEEPEPESDEAEEPVEHIEKPEREILMETGGEQNNTVEPEDSGEPVFIEPQAAEQEEQQPSLLRRLRNKIFDAGETDSIYQTSESDENDEGKNLSFFERLKEKLRHKEPAEDEETEKIEKHEEPVPMSEEKPVPEKQPEPEIKEEKPEKPEQKTGETLEIGISKGENGSIVIDSLKGSEGVSVPVKIKDGNAELKAKEERIAANIAVLDDVSGLNSSTEIVYENPANKTDSRPSQQEGSRKGKKGRKKKKKNKNNSTINNAETAIAATAEAGAVIAAAAGTAGAGAAIAAAEGIVGADAINVKSAEKTSVKSEQENSEPTEAVKTKLEKSEPAEAVKAEPEKPEPTEAVKAEPEKPEPTEAVKAKPEKPEPTEAVKAEPEKPEPAEAVKAEPEKPEPTEAVKAEPEKSEPAEDVKAEPEKPEPAEDVKAEPEKPEPTEAVKTEPEKSEPAEAVKAEPEKPEPTEAVKAEPEKPEPTEAVKIEPEKSEPTEAVKTEPEKSEPTEAVKAEPEKSEPAEPQKPVFNFRKESGIIFEYPTERFRRTFVPRNDYLTVIPSLESVNADDYNRMVENILSGKAVQPSEKPEPETVKPAENIPAPLQPQQPVSPVRKPLSRKANRKQEEKIEFYSEDSEDNTLDPFAPGSGEIPLKDLEEKSNEGIGTKLKKSFGKLFTAAGDEE